MQDNSVLFSLNELQRLEAERVREEREVAQARVMAEEKAKEEAARREMEKAAQKAQEEAQRKAREEAEKRAEAARLEAIRLAAVEKARIEAEAAARLEMMKKAEEHERHLVALKEDEKKKKLKRALISSVIGAVVLLGGGAGIYFGKIVPDTQAQLTQQQAEINRKAEEAARLKAELDKNGKRIEDAEARLLEARRKAAEEATANQNDTKEVRPKGPTNGTTKTTDGNKTGGQCLPGEPGCGLDGTRLF